jgi:hypothetical protein
MMQNEAAKDRRFVHACLLFLLAFAAVAGIFTARFFHNGGWSWFGSVVIGVLLAPLFAITGHLWLQGLFRMIGAVHYVFYLVRTKPKRWMLSAFLVSLLPLLGLLATGGGIMVAVGCLEKKPALSLLGILTVLSGFLIMALGLLPFILYGFYVKAVGKDRSRSP